MGRHRFSALYFFRYLLLFEESEMYIGTYDGANFALASNIF